MGNEDSGKFKSSSYGNSSGSIHGGSTGTNNISANSNANMNTNKKIKIYELQKKLSRHSK